MGQHQVHAVSITFYNTMHNTV